MNAPRVAQSEALADLFEEALQKIRPRSVAILGIAGGNGLSRIDPAVTTRIVGVDVNPAYLETVRDRFHAKLPLKLFCLDLSVEAVPDAPVDLVHAALIFEHAGTERCLDTAISLVASGGHLSTVLQLPPSKAEPNVAPSQYSSMQALSKHFRLVEPDNLCQVMTLRGFGLQYESRRALPEGKGFWLGIFRRLL